MLAHMHARTLAEAQRRCTRAGHAMRGSLPPRSPPPESIRQQKFALLRISTVDATVAETASLPAEKGRSKEKKPASLLSKKKTCAGRTPAAASLGLRPAMLPRAVCGGCWLPKGRRPAPRCRKRRWAAARGHPLRRHIFPGEYRRRKKRVKGGGGGGGGGCLLVG